MSHDREDEHSAVRGHEGAAQTRRADGRDGRARHGRADDADMSAVKRRVDTFNNVTMPAIRWLQHNPNVDVVKLAIQDADVDVNYANFKTALNNALKQNHITL